MGEGELPFSRWWLVAAAALAMGAIGTYQFAWSSIRVPLGSRIGAPESALGTVFTVYVVFQTLSQFPAGLVRDRFGPRLPLVVAAPLVVVGYVGVAVAGTPAFAYLAYAIGGVGAGVVYTVVVNTPVKWFDERRGLATGIATTTYGGLSFVAIPLLRSGLDDHFRATLFALAAFVGAAVLVGVQVLRDPGDDRRGVEVSAAGDDQLAKSQAYGWRGAIGTWQFWLLYAVFVAVNGVGLMLIGKVVSFAGALGLSETAATATAALVALGDAVGLILIGHLADRVGHARTLATSLALAGLAMVASIAAGVLGASLGFVVATTDAAFFRSPTFVIVPSLVGEYYGTAYSSEVYAALYTAKLWGGVLGGVVASALIARIDWAPAFSLGAGVLATAGLTVFLLRPVERT